MFCYEVLTERGKAKMRSFYDEYDNFLKKYNEGVLGCLTFDNSGVTPPLKGAVNARASSRSAGLHGLQARKFKSARSNDESEDSRATDSN